MNRIALTTPASESSGVVTLGDLARGSGWSPADVAFMAGVEESTVSRLWNAEDWADRIKGKTLRCLIASLPGVGDFVVSNALRRRRRSLVESLESVGLTVDLSSFHRLLTVEQVPEQLLANALAATYHVANGALQETSKHLARFWSRRPDEVLAVIWRPSSEGGIFAKTVPLLEKAENMARILEVNLNSQNSMIAHATLVHHVARSSGHWIHPPFEESPGRRMAMSHRSLIMGHILHTGDEEAVQRYHHELQGNRLLSMVERWAFPTYNRDVGVSSDFSLPGSVLLRRTAEEFLADLWTENEAYLRYLLGTAIPFMLRHDSTFGLRAEQVARAVQRRMESTYDTTTRRVGGETVRRLLG